MGQTDYAGIDYSLGMANRDEETGISYGVVPVHAVGERWYGDSEANYGKPHCPKCGNEAREATEEEQEKFDCGERSDCEYFCEGCEALLDSGEVWAESPLSFYYLDEEYALEQDAEDVDIWVSKSPYFTRAQFCSPCAPGAGYLMNPCDAGPRTYCLGHEWFEAVKTGRMVPCPACRGLGVRWVQGGSLEGRLVRCWVCKGGVRPEYVTRAPYPVYRVSDGAEVEALVGD